MSSFRPSELLWAKRWSYLFGASLLKSMLTQALSEYLRPIRQRRQEIEKDPDFVRSILKKGTDRAREVAQKTLIEVRRAMGMIYE